MELLSKLFMLEFGITIYIINGFISWIEFSCLMTVESLWGDNLLWTTQVHSSWHSFGESQRDERLRRPASHKVVLNQWPINWKSCTISTTPLYWLGSTILNSFKNGIKNGGNKQTTIRTVWNNALNCVSLTQHQKPIPLCVIYTAHDICNYTYYASTIKKCYSPLFFSLCSCVFLFWIINI